jgi:acyl-CoA thioester hydrolase
VLVWMDYVANTSAPWPQEVLAQMATQFKAAA